MPSTQHTRDYDSNDQSSASTAQALMKDHPSFNNDNNNNNEILIKHETLVYTRGRCAVQNTKQTNNNNNENL